MTDVTRRGAATAAKEKRVREERRERKADEAGVPSDRVRDLLRTGGRPDGEDEKKEKPKRVRPPRPPKKEGDAKGAKPERALYTPGARGGHAKRGGGGGEKKPAEG